MACLRIVYAVPFYYPATQFGGPVAQLRLVCRQLARLGHQVRVVTTDNGVGPELPRDQWVDLDGYQVWYGRTGWLNRIPPYYEPMLRPPLTEALRDADVLHLHVAFTLLNELARKVSRELSVPYVYAPRGCLAPARLRARRLSKWLFLRLYERRVIRQAAGLHAVAQSEVAHLVNQGADRQRIRTIVNGVDVQQETGDGDSWRRRLGIGAEDPVVLFLGQLIAIKGLDLLIDAVARIKNRFPQVHLIVAGPDGGGLATAVKHVALQGLEQSVHFVGHLDGSQKSDVLACADVFALASRDEGLPNAVIEACAAELPVLITPGCNLPEVANYEAGLVVPHEVDKLAAALERMLSDSALRRRMGKNGRRMVLEKFSIVEVATLLEALYTSVIDRES